MRNTIIITNKKGFNILKISNIKIEKDVIYKIYYNLYVDVDIFKSSANLEAEFHDFINLSKGLTNIYHGKWKEVVFCSSVNEQLTINFKLIDNGNVKIKFVVNSNLYDGKLESEFLTDLISIKKLIEDINLTFCETLPQS